MNISLSTPAADAVDTVVGVLAAWQADATIHNLHPGDIGWHLRNGPDKTASCLRCWSTDDGTIVAIGLLDLKNLLRVATAPSARRDKSLAEAMAADITDPARGVLPEGEISIDIASDALLYEKLSESEGWTEGKEWVWLRRDGMTGTPMNTNTELSFQIVTTEEHISQRVQIQKLAFPTSTFSVEKWHAMASTAAYKTARCLLAYKTNISSEPIPVGVTTVWSAGLGRPGILEPLGVSAAHQGHGIGKALTYAAAEHLYKMGASSAMVATPRDNHAAVRTYQSAGFVEIRATRDLTRRK